MGWDQVFEPFYWGKDLGTKPPGVGTFCKTRRGSPAWGGSQFRILRGPDRGVFTAGLTHAFRLRGTWSLRDAREVMSHVQVDWNWLRLPDGRVLDKEGLLQFSHPLPPRGAGLSR